MAEEDTWTTLFFSGGRPDILKMSELDGKSFRPFCAKDDNWKLGPRADISRSPDANAIQVFWLRIRGHRYISKVVSGDNTLRVLRVNHIPVSLLF